MATRKLSSNKKKKSPRQNSISIVRQPFRFSRNQLLIVMVAILAIGGFVVWRVLAATPSNTEVETWTASSASGVAVKSDSTASAGSYATFLATVSSPSTNSVAPPVAADAGKTWGLKFNEDFNGNSVDLNKWTPCFSWAGSYDGCTTSFNAGREAYQPSQVQLSNGTAKLVAEPANPKIWGLDYKSGLLSTTNKPSGVTGTLQGPSLYKFTYGYAEARLKMPAQKGFFSAFWMLPVSKNPNGGWPYEYEIDILEALGGNDPYAYQTIHYNNRSQQWQASSPPGQCKNWTASDLYGNFHTYGVNWQPTYIDFYIDGIKCDRFTNEIWKSDMELILNLMVDHSWQKAYPSLYGATGTGVLEVDYVKVWQQQ